MYAGSLPPTSIYNTWIENIELSSADDGGLVDLSTVDDIQVKLLDPETRFEELKLTLSHGDVTLPSLGIIQWRAAQTQMATLFPKFYEVLILLIDAGDTTTLALGNISIVE